MAYYAYKRVRDLIPDHIIKAQGEDYEGDGNYDGDQWDATADYVQRLELELKKQIRTSKVVFDAELISWLKTRPETSYALGGWDLPKENV